MALTNHNKPIQVQLAKDLTRSVKQGHAWLYHDALRPVNVTAEAGQPAILLDNRGGKEIARGFYDPEGAIALRICTVKYQQFIKDHWAEEKMQAAWKIRQQFIKKNTSGFRLFNGEGDGLPGLVCDIYNDTAVIKLDGPAAENFWQVDGISEWLQKNISVKAVYQRFRRQNGAEGRWLTESKSPQLIEFQENDFKFLVDVIAGQKTGFFLDQRDNRFLIHQLSKNKTVLNVFGYTGGFSVAAGMGGAKTVTTVDLAKPALELADKNWRLNHLAAEKHQSLAADALEYLAENQAQYDLVILDPPSFAPSEAAVIKATQSYTNIISSGALATLPGGLLAAASCSSHIHLPKFLECCKEGLGKAGKRATILQIGSQGSDHPSPLAMPELRYLKFVLMQID